MQKTRWGLLGAGQILDRWMKGFRQLEDAEIPVIASRSIGYIRIPVFWKPESAEIFCGDKIHRIEKVVPQRINGMNDEGYQFEIRHVQECLQSGLTESPLITHEMTHNVLKVCDEVRRQWAYSAPQSSAALPVSASPAAD